MFRFMSVNSLNIVVNPYPMMQSSRLPEVTHFLWHKNTAFPNNVQIAP